MAGAAPWRSSRLSPPPRQDLQKASSPDGEPPTPSTERLTPGSLLKKITSRTPPSTIGLRPGGAAGPARRQTASSRCHLKPGAGIRAIFRCLFWIFLLFALFLLSHGSLCRLVSQHSAGSKEGPPADLSERNQRHSPIADPERHAFPTSKDSLTLSPHSRGSVGTRFMWGQ